MAHYCPSCEDICTCSGDTESAVVGTLAGCSHLCDDFDAVAAHADEETF